MAYQINSFRVQCCLDDNVWDGLPALVSGRGRALACEHSKFHRLASYHHSALGKYVHQYHISGIQKDPFCYIGSCCGHAARHADRRRLQLDFRFLWVRGPELALLSDPRFKQHQQLQRNSYCGGGGMGGIWTVYPNPARNVHVVADEQAKLRECISQIGMIEM